MTYAATLGELASPVRSLYRSALGWRSGLGVNDWRKTFKGADLFTLLDKPDEIEGLFKYRLEKLNVGSPPCIIMRPGRDADTMLPIVQFRYEKDADFEKLSFRVGFLQRVDNPGGPFGFFGYRYESPERGMTHNFFHIQPIRGFNKNDAVQQYSYSWMPTRFPTFPVASRDPFELFVVMLYSVQGDSALQSFTSAGESARATEILKRLKAP